MKNLMDDKKLDINQPFLTVRRFSATLNSEKDVKTNDNHRSLPSLPLLPSQQSGPVRNPGRVPFMWEESPGRPKTDKISQAQALNQVPTIPKLPPGKTARRKCCEKFPSISECASSLERDSDGCEEESSRCKEDDRAYLDAINRLSRSGSGSSFLSGLSGTETKPSSSTFSADSQTCDFMMGRFLPAAKDLASEKPRYVSRQHPRKVTDTVVKVDERRKFHNPTSNNILPNFVECKKDEEIKEEKNGTGQDSARICGLLPNCCLLNPIPGIILPLSYVRNSRARSSSASSLEGQENELKRPATLEASRYDKNKLEHETTMLNQNVAPIQQLKKSSSQRIHGGAETDVFSCLISLERSSNSYRRFLASQNALSSPRHVLKKAPKLKSDTSSVVKLNESEETPSHASLSKCIEGSDVVNEGVGSESFPGKLMKDCGENQDVEDQKELPNVESDAKFPLPPLPKSPSESWLWRTLPSMSSRNPSSCSYLGAKMNYQYNASRYANW